MMEVLNHLSALLLLSLLPPSLSHVVGKFSEVKECSDFFLEGTTPSLPGILVGGTVQDPDRYKLICQRYINSYRFATLYDTTNKIPVFSAYTYTGLPTGIRRNTWKIEPQLNIINNYEMIEMIEDKGKDPYPNQAGDNDYKGKMGINELSRGHLFPVSHAHDQDTKDSTFTLTNIVPQVGSFNSGSWNQMEGEVLKALNDNCKDDNNNIEAYVVTGAVPSESNKLKSRVNIPSLLWTAYCCYNSTQDKWVAEAHWGENQKEDDKGKTLPSKTLAELYEMLNNETLNKKESFSYVYRIYLFLKRKFKNLFYYKGVEVFPEKCSSEIIPGKSF